MFRPPDLYKVPLYRAGFKYSRYLLIKQRIGVMCRIDWGGLSCFLRLLRVILRRYHFAGISCSNLV